MFMSVKRRLQSIPIQGLLLALLVTALPFAATSRDFRPDAGSQAASEPRDSYEQPQKVLEVTGVKPGMTIGEVGAGGGHFTVLLARAVGRKGRIYANDILRSAIEKIDRRSADEGFTNIETILGAVDDPRFPRGALDMVFMVNCFHEFEKPIELLANLLPSLKPGATVVIMDRDPTRARHSGEHLYTQEEMAETIGRSVFALVRTETFLPYHNLYILKARQ
jgi:ubiquinone/menaquinone biosynthesis C-methylase UbiE